MRWSRLFIPTLREAPAEAEVVSHRLLLRAGYVRQLSAGLYCYLYLAKRSLNKIERIVREEMDAIGAQEVYTPEIHPAEVWQESGRWQAIGDDMFRLKDRNGRELCLGMTEEEVMTWMARGELRSYKQLPQIWYQIQAKFRDEPRPKSGLMRVRRFTMKDSYSFDIDKAGLDESYQKHYEAYCRIFSRCGLEYLAIQAHSGAMGGSESHEFVIPSGAGEDWVVESPASGYAANLEKAVARPKPPAEPDPDGDEAPEEFATPGKKTIAEVSEFDGAAPTSHVKTLLYVADGKPVMALLRGDHTLNETKLAGVTGAGELRPAHPEELRQWLGADAGSLGPVGVKTKMRMLADTALEGRRNLIAGANKDGFHLRNVTPGRDFQPEFVDLREVEDGDLDIASGEPVRRRKCIEVGHIFKLGYKYSESMGLRVLDENGKEVTPIMGSYGIGLERILTAAIEQNHDDAGMALPVAVAPFEAVVTPVNLKDEQQRETAEKLYAELSAAGVDALFDDRAERAGVKFNDADLVGIPLRVVVGKKIAEGLVELVERSTRQSLDVKLENVVELVKERLQQSPGNST
ncbi:MAG: proline--tRNA ligase [Acidobacteria bacterium]|nr:proline--tRNA ligase [Acidobacteriota bacterium]